MSDLNLQAARGLLQLAAVMAGLLFVPAWTLDYWQAWIFLAVFFGASIAITLYLTKKDPSLLQRRVAAGPAAEKEPAQKIIMGLASLGFIGLVLVPALDRRFGWSRVATSTVLAGDALVALGFLIVFLVFKENTFTASTIEVAENQKVISTGPYSVVRHPMYAGGLILLFGMPLALASRWGLVAWLAMAPTLVWRLVDEERLLSKALPGYVEYKQLVRWRLIPGIF